MEILLYGNSILTKKAEPVTCDDSDLSSLISDLSSLVNGETSIGLAAPQIGVGKQVAVCRLMDEYDRGSNGERLNPGIEFPFTIINPRISAVSTKMSESREGCLSFPKIFFPVERHEEIEVEYDELKDGKFSRVKREFKGFLARVLQHEMDHLEGVLFIDHATPMKRSLLGEKLIKIKKKAAKQRKRL